jgi:hypothetical protein
MLRPEDIAPQGIKVVSRLLRVMERGNGNLAILYPYLLDWQKTLILSKYP